MVRHGDGPHVVHEWKLFTRLERSTQLKGQRILWHRPSLRRRSCWWGVGERQGHWREPLAAHLCCLPACHLSACMPVTCLPACHLSVCQSVYLHAFKLLDYFIKLFWFWLSGLCCFQLSKLFMESSFVSFTPVLLCRLKHWEKDHVVEHGEVRLLWVNFPWMNFFSSCGRLRCNLYNVYIIELFLHCRRIEI